MARYVVTGCAGFLGSTLVDRLLAVGHDVVGIDSFTDYYPRALKEANLAEARCSPSFVLAELDLASDPLDRVAGGCEGIYHLAARPGVRTSWAEADVAVTENVVATQRLLSAAGRAGARLVVASSSTVYGDSEGLPFREDAVPAPSTPYGVHKLACEQLAGAYGARGLDAVVLRYFSLYGPRQRPDMLIARALAALSTDGALTLYGGHQSRDFTYVGDAVEATVLAMERAPAGAVLNVGAGEEVGLTALVALLEATAGRPLRTIVEPPREGEPARTLADRTRARELGWEPTTALSDGLAAQLEWWLARDGSARSPFDAASA